LGSGPGYALTLSLLNSLFFYGPKPACFYIGAFCVNREFLTYVSQVSIPFCIFKYFQLDLSILYLSFGGCFRNGLSTCQIQAFLHLNLENLAFWWDPNWVVIVVLFHKLVLSKWLHWYESKKSVGITLYLERKKP